MYKIKLTSLISPKYIIGTCSLGYFKFRWITEEVRSRRSDFLVDDFSSWARYLTLCLSRHRYRKSLGKLLSTPRKTFSSRTCIIFLLTGLRIYTGEYKAQGPTLCPTEGSYCLTKISVFSPFLKTVTEARNHG